MNNTVLPYTVHTDSSEESDSSDSSEEGNLLSNNLGVVNNKFETKNVRFMNQEKAEDYQMKRNQLFTPETYVRLITIDNTSSNTFSLTENLNIKNTDIIGFKIIKSNVKHTDTAKYYSDLVISEIPDIGCDKNETGNAIITRIPLVADTAYHYHSYLELSLINRYFYPQKIKKLTLSFLNETTIIGNFTFEITYLNDKVHTS